MRRIVMMLISVLIGFGVFIAILSVANQKADTESISTLKERCSSLYDGQGRIRQECQQLIRQSIKNGQRPSHEASKDGVNVLWR